MSGITKSGSMVCCCWGAEEVPNDNQGESLGSAQELLPVSFSLQVQSKG